MNFWVGNPPEEIAPVFAHAINIMRETNPKNLNFPYMLSDYATHLVDPFYSDDHKEMLREWGRPVTVMDKADGAGTWLT